MRGLFLVMLLIGCVSQISPLGFFIEGYDEAGNPILINPSSGLIELTAYPNKVGDKIWYTFEQKGTGKMFISRTLPADEIELGKLVISNPVEQDFTGGILIEVNFPEYGVNVGNYFKEYTTELGITYKTNYTVYFCNKTPSRNYTDKEGDPEIPIAYEKTEKFTTDFCFLNCFSGTKGEIRMGIPKKSELKGPLLVYYRDINKEIEKRRVLGHYQVIDSSCNFTKTDYFKMDINTLAGQKIGEIKINFSS